MKQLAALFLLVSLLLAGCAQTPGTTTDAGQAQGSGAANADPASSTTYSSPADRIKATKRAILDMRSGKLTHESGGLGADQHDFAVDVPEGIDLNISTPKKWIEAKPTNLNVYADDRDSEALDVEYSLSADNNDAFFAMLQDGVKNYGIPGVATDQLIKAINQDPNFSQSNDLGTGRATGVQVRYFTKFDGAKGVRKLTVRVTPQPPYAPAAASPLKNLWADDPMAKYVETITTPEEKAAQQQAYTALPEIRNAASPVHETPNSVYQDLFDHGVITAAYRDQNKSQTEWGTGQSPMRDRGDTYQVTAIYCPMHEQMLAVLDRGYLSCSFTGQYMDGGSPITRAAAEDITGMVEAEPDFVQHAQVYMKKDGGTWKVDNIKFQFLTRGR